MRKRTITAATTAKSEPSRGSPGESRQGHRPEAGYAEAYSNRGNALRDLNDLAEALANYDKAIALKPDFAQAHNNRGAALQEYNRPAEALASYKRRSPGSRIFRRRTAIRVFACC